VVLCSLRIEFFSILLMNYINNKDLSELMP
jgi:hypothetical protein